MGYDDCMLLEDEFYTRLTTYHSSSFAILKMHLLLCRLRRRRKRMNVLNYNTSSMNVIDFEAYVLIEFGVFLVVRSNSIWGVPRRRK